MKLDIRVEDNQILSFIVGVNDRNLALFKTLLDVDIEITENYIITNADESLKEVLEDLFTVLIKAYEYDLRLSERDLIYMIKLAQKNQVKLLIPFYEKRYSIIVDNQGKPVFPKTLNQYHYVNALNNYDMTFGVGPAGTGKTYLAVAQAVKLLKKNDVKKIILTRPAVEAGESLGFLPGDLKEKIDPYLIPLYDALYDMLGKATTTQLIEKGIIEIAPLAYMRGRTLENACVILDEAQNTSVFQMKMFLTRMGFQSKMIITGDPSQVDLPKGVKSGLKQALTILEDIKEIKIINFDNIDVIRHPLVQKVLERYDQFENKRS